MSVYKDTARGSWFVQYHLKDQPTIRKRGFATKREAMAWEREKRAEGSQTSMTFKAVADKYIENSNYNDFTKVQKKHRVIKYLKPIKDVPISKIKKAQLMDWRNDLVQKSGLSASTCNSLISLVKSSYRYAADYLDIKDISFVLSSAKKSKDDRKEMSVWTVEEFERFIACVDHPIYNAFFRCLYWAGLRKGEAIALLKTDLTDQQDLLISKTIYRKEVHSPKTNAGTRSVRLDDETYKYLLPLTKRAGRYLFGDLAPLSTSQIDRYFLAGIKKSGVPKIRIHDLRHSHATNLINAGANIVAVSKRLGHSDVSMTLKVYTHLLQKTDEQLINTLNCLAKGAKKVPRD